MSGFFAAREIEGTAQSTKLSKCGKCGLYKKAITPKMKVEGSGERKILFVGSAPREDDDRQGGHFVSEEGQLLIDILDDAGIDLSECWSTYSVICKPDDYKVESNQVSCCRPNLLKTIKKLKPKVIIPLGREALTSLLSKEWKKDIGTIGRWVGWNIPSNYLNAWLCPTFDLAYLLKMDNKSLNNICQEHIEKAVAMEQIPIKNPLLKKLEKKVEIILDPDYAKRRLANLSTKKGILAFDYETTGLKPERKEQKIVSVSFCLNGKDTFACMVDDSHLEFISGVLKNPKLKKVASNLKFEERWTRAKLGHGVRNWHWDTMLAAHVLDNRSSITSIKFQAFMYLGIPDYDSHINHLLKSETANGLNRIHEIPKKELLLYNGLDSLLEYMIMKKQRRLFND